MMLAEDDKTRLKLEEEFRYEVRKSLEQAKPPLTLWAKIGRIINSPFGLFFLSTVVIGFLSWSYTKWDATQKIEAQHKESIRKLYIEIPYRITSARRAMDLAHWGPEGAIRSKKAALEQLRGTKSVFPEFEGRPLFLLLFELHSLVPDEKKQEVYRVYEKSLALYDIEPAFLWQKSQEETEYEERVMKEFPKSWEDYVGKSLTARGIAVEKFNHDIWPELEKAANWKSP